jgi:hypothetical protein
VGEMEGLSPILPLTRYIEIGWAGIVYPENIFGPTYHQRSARDTAFGPKLDSLRNFLVLGSYRVSAGVVLSLACEFYRAGLSSVELWSKGSFFACPTFHPS